MPLIEMQLNDKTEILEDGTIQVRMANRVIREETGETVAQSFSRYVLTPEDMPADDAPSRLKAICAAVHTDECKAAYAAKKAAQQAKDNIPADVPEAPVEGV